MLKIGEIFSETTGFLIAIQDRVIGHNNLIFLPVALRPNSGRGLLIL